MTSLMRLKLLTRMQTVALLRKKKIDSRNRKIVRAIVYFVTLLLVTFAIYGLFWLLPVLGLKIVDYPLINFVIVFIQVISVIACANGLMNSLFLSNDNPILLAFPATHVEIFVSKLLVYYISEFIRSFSFIVPVLFAFGLNQKYGVLYYLIVMLFSVILPLDRKSVV